MCPVHFFLLDYIDKCIKKKKKTKIPFAFYARRKRETLRWYSHGLDVYVSGRLDHMSITAPTDKTT